MEPVGVALGAVSLLVPAVQGYQKCATLLKTYQKYPKDFKKLQENLLIQKRIFDRECLLLLGSLIEQNVAAEMLVDCNHAKWSDQDLSDCWARELGGCFNIPLKIINETLVEIEQEFISYQNQARKFQAISQKIKWSISGKPNIEGLLDTLRTKNQDLRLLRGQKNSLQNPQNQPRVIRCKSLGASSLAIRDSANRLYDGLLAIAACPCHYVDLRLKHLENGNFLPFAGSKNTQTVNFRLVITTDTEIQDIKSICTCLTVHSELHLVNVPQQNLSEVSEVSEKMEMLPDIILGRNYNQQNRPVCAAGETNRWPIVGASTPSSITIHAEKCPPIVKFNHLPEPTSDTAIIQNLCTHLETHQLRADVQANECLGIIQSTTCTINYRHLIYHDPPTYPITSRVPLSSIFERVDKQRLLPREERLRIAFILSLSLIYFGSYPNSWFRDRWRTCDIFFFLDNKSQLPALDSTLIPYISTPLQRSDKGKAPEITLPSSVGPISTRSGVGLARNEKLFSLALALIEIAFGDSIFNLKNPSGLFGSDSEFSEFIKVKNIVDSLLLVSEMGPVYARVVKQCFYCDFGIGEEDLSKQEVQEIYYEKVVCELERCLKTFKGD